MKGLRMFGALALMLALVGMLFGAVPVRAQEVGQVVKVEELEVRTGPNQEWVLHIRNVYREHALDGLTPMFASWNFSPSSDINYYTPTNGGGHTTNSYWHFGNSSSDYSQLECVSVPNNEAVKWNSEPEITSETLSGTPSTWNGVDWPTNTTLDYVNNTSGSTVDIYMQLWGDYSDWSNIAGNLANLATFVDGPGGQWIKGGGNVYAPVGYSDNGGAYTWSNPDPCDYANLGWHS